MSATDVEIDAPLAVPDAPAAHGTAPHATAPLRFTCNYCGRGNRVPMRELTREGGACRRCGSTVRLRAMLNVLSVELFGRSLALGEMPKRKDLRGIGLSDWSQPPWNRFRFKSRASLASGLAEKFDYTNTFYHQSPHLDVHDPDPALRHALDFVVATDVFEHVAPPVDDALRKTRELLRPRGVVAFSVPYKLDGATDEHFPELFEWRIDDSGAAPTLINYTRSGERQVFGNLVFHGGAGSTLEMRLFSLAGLTESIRAAGFAEPRIHGEEYPKYGIHWEGPWSLPMALRPRTVL